MPGNPVLYAIVANAARYLTQVAGFWTALCLMTGMSRLLILALDNDVGDYAVLLAATVVSARTLSKMISC